MKGSYNYRTYSLGSLADLEKSESLVLLVSDDFGGISLDRLKKLQDIVSENPEGKPVKTSLGKNDEGAFKFEFGEDELFGFDTVIYVNPISGYVGYTIFSSVQRCYSSSRIPFKKLNIFLRFSTNQEDGNDAFLKFKVFLDFNAENTEILGNTERWQYQTFKEVTSSKEDNEYLKFTNRIPDFLRDPSLLIMTDSTFSFHENNSGSLSKRTKVFTVLSGIEVDSSSFQVLKPVYNTKLSLVKYSPISGRYEGISLSDISYQDGLPGIGLRPGTVEGVSGELIDCDLNIFLFSDDTHYTIYNTRNKTLTKYPKQVDGRRNYIFLKRYDSNLGGISFISEDSLKEELSKICSIPRNFGGIFEKRIGKWWMFREGSRILYASVYGYIEGNVEIRFITDRLAVFEKSGICHFLPIDLGHTYEILQDGRILDKKSKEYVDIQISPSTPFSSLSINERLFLSGLRRKPLRLRGCFPEESTIVGTEAGMIFYLSNGLLYCY